MPVRRHQSVNRPGQATANADNDPSRPGRARFFQWKAADREWKHFGRCAVAGNRPRNNNPWRSRQVGPRRFFKLRETRCVFKKSNKLQSGASLSHRKSSLDPSRSGSCRTPKQLGAKARLMAWPNMLDPAIESTEIDWLLADGCDPASGLPSANPFSHGRRDSRPGRSRDFQIPPRLFPAPRQTRTPHSPPQQFFGMLPS
jgi:hypothetical protein